METVTGEGKQISIIYSVLARQGQACFMQKVCSITKLYTVWVNFLSTKDFSLSTVNNTNIKFDVSCEVLS